MPVASGQADTAPVTGGPSDGKREGSLPVVGLVAGGRQTPGPRSTTVMSHLEWVIVVAAAMHFRVLQNMDLGCNSSTSILLDLSTTSFAANDN